MRKDFVSFILALVFVAVVVSAAFAVRFVYNHTNGFATDFKTFYVRYDGKDIMNDTALELPVCTELRFDCKYSLDFLRKSKDKEKGYSIKLLPNPDAADFDFIYNGQLYSFRHSGELTEYFSVAEHDGYFTLKLDKSMFGIFIMRFASGGGLSLPDIDFSAEYYFRLVVTSFDGSSVINIDIKANFNGSPVPDSEIPGGFFNSGGAV